MARIEVNETKQQRNGKPVRTYTVHWSEGGRRGQETYADRADAEARKAEYDTARTLGGVAAMADARRAGKLTYGHYAEGWLAEQKGRVAEADLKPGTYHNHVTLLDRYVRETFWHRPIASIGYVECSRFRSDLAAHLAPRSVRNVWWTFAEVFRYAMDANAIQVSPAQHRRGRRKSARPAEGFAPHPLTPSQIGTLAAAIGELTDPVYELMFLFLCYTGLRKGECQGLTVADLTLTHSHDGSVSGVVRVERNLTKREGKWASGTPKSGKGRTVPLPPWLAARIADYLASAHERADEPSAPLWPNRLQGGARRKGQRAEARLDFSEPVELANFTRRTLRPALEAAGLTVSRAKRRGPDGTVEPAVSGFRLHDTRHTFAVLQLTSGEHYLQVSKWLGHANPTITMSVYADYLPEAEPVNRLPEPVAAQRKTGNVIRMQPKTGT